MIRLAVAVGFLGVFGFVAWAIIVLLKDSFKDKDQPTTNKTDEN